MNNLDAILNNRWEGYPRSSGPAGIRNKILVIYTVECSRFVAEEIARRSGDTETEAIGFYGCTDNQYAVRLLVALARHPNVGGVLAVGLGCEYVQAKRLAAAAAKAGRLSHWFTIQEAGGTLPSIEQGLETVRRMRKELEGQKKVPMGLSDLIIGAECGGSDYTSGLAGNLSVGRFFDLLCDAGGCCIFEEIVEAVGLKMQLVSRAATPEVGQKLSRVYDKAMEYCSSVGQYSVSPGNFAGGLSSIEEKSMGAFVKSGSRPIQGVLKVGQQPPQRGLWLLDTTPDPWPVQYGITNPNDSEGLTALIASGCQLVFLVTGRGSVIGSAVAPTLKITGNHTTFTNMSGDMDFDASPVLSGEESPAELGLRLCAAVISAASGTKTKSEALCHKEYCIPYKYQQNGAVQCSCKRE